jgi:hypothetical protein
MGHVRKEYPAHWVKSAIPYGQLKKCLKNVAEELHGFGLNPAVMRELLAREEATYKLDSAHILPCSRGTTDWLTNCRYLQATARTT